MRMSRIINVIYTCKTLVSGQYSQFDQIHAEYNVGGNAPNNILQRGVLQLPNGVIPDGEISTRKDTGLQKKSFDFRGIQIRFKR